MKKYMKKQVLTTVLFLIFLSVAVSATQHLISLQGYASDSSNIPLSEGNISVRIYDNASGGSLVYDSGDDFNDAITDGIYDILLGSNTSLDLDNTKKYHMEIDINGGEVVGNDTTDGRQEFWPGGGDHSLPTGIIVMWSGDLASIPDGWALCDGTQGTPDLSGRFIVSYDENDPAYNPIGDLGGQKYHTLTPSEMPSHRHSYSGNTDSGGEHTHDFSDTAMGVVAGDERGDRDGGPYYTDYEPETEPAGNHGHYYSGNTNYQGSNSAHENRPPYYTLAFIMKI